jgi:hypothetical protein
MGVLVTLAGQVIDLLCYDVQTKATGMDHPMGKECAWLTASDVTMVKAPAK